MNKYLLSENGDEFILEAHTIDQAQRNAEAYNSVVIGLIHEPCGSEYFPADENYDWSLHITEK